MSWVNRQRLRPPPPRRKRSPPTRSWASGHPAETSTATLGSTGRKTPTPRCAATSRRCRGRTCPGLLGLSVTGRGVDCSILAASRQAAGHLFATPLEAAPARSSPLVMEARGGTGPTGASRAGLAFSARTPMAMGFSSAVTARRGSELSVLQRRRQRQTRRLSSSCSSARRPRR